MFKSLVTNKNYFNTIFSEKHFEFVYNFSTEINELNSKISYQENLQNKIVQYIDFIPKLFNEDSCQIDTQYLYKLSNDVSGIYSLINTNIQILSELGNYLNSIRSEIEAVLSDLDFEESDYPEEYHKLGICKIKLEIDNYLTFSEESKKIIENNNDTINQFLFDVESNKVLSTSTNTLKTNNKGDNNVLIISEIDNKIFLPYSVEELEYYLKTFPDKYTSFENVIASQFILPFDYYMRYPAKSRFKEAYALSKNRELHSTFVSLKYALQMMINRKLNPAIIAACKTKQQLENYISCLKNNNLSNFKDFEIKFEINLF